MKLIKAGVIGTGFIGMAHIEAIKRNPGIELVAIVDVNTERAGVIADQYGVGKTYGKWEDMLTAGGIDTVHNCTPNNRHFVINKAFLEAGIHVLSEKPLCMNSNESAELVAIAEKSELANAVDFNYRGYPLSQQARSLVEKGELGTINLVHGHYLQDWLLYETDYNWRLEPEEGGTSRAVADIGSHWCDLIQFITGLKIKSVFADLSTVHPFRNKPETAIETFKGREISQPDSKKVKVDTEDTAGILLRFENGARGAVSISQVSPGRKNRFWYEIDGSKSSLSWNQEEPDKLWLGHRDRANEVMIKDPALLNDDVRSFAHYPGGHPEGYPDGLKNIVRKFYDYIAAGGPQAQLKPEFPTFLDGHLEIKMVEAVLASYKAQQWVDV